MTTPAEKSQQKIMNIVVTGIITEKEMPRIINACTKAFEEYEQKLEIARNGLEEIAGSDKYSASPIMTAIRFLEKLK
jgi:hypothetical protein